MPNQENIKPGKKPMTKQEYNKHYYLQNKNRWPSKRKDQPRTNVFQLFSRVVQVTQLRPTSMGRWMSFVRRIELCILLSLTGLITAFLIQEAAGFYLDAQEGPLVAYLKAGLIETIVILFALSRSKQRVLRWAQKAVMVMLCGFTLFVMSGRLVKTAVGETFKVQSMRQTLQQLESELSQKEGLRNQFLTHEWLGAVRRLDRGLDQVRGKVVALRQELSTLQQPEVVMSHLGILLSFRLILVVANLILFHLIVERICDKESPESSKMEGRRVASPGKLLKLSEP